MSDPAPTPDPVLPARQADRRMLVVHAHPDDETIGTGATMAKYVAQGVGVALVTCTLGEEGEVLVPELAHLAADEQDKLGPHRQGELAAAMAALGVRDWRLLGEPGRYRDSGMAGLPTNDAAGSFWRADLLAAATDLVAVIRQVRPHVLITYDEFGGYGHPDHVQANRVAMYAAVLAAAPSFCPELGTAWDIPKIYWTALPKSVLRRGIQALRDSGDTSPIAQLDLDGLPFGVDDDVVTTRIDGGDQLSKKIAALHSYPTQIAMDSGFFALADLADAAMATEYYRLVRGSSGPLDADGYETDLFAGLPDSG